MKAIMTIVFLAVCAIATAQKGKNPSNWSTYPDGNPRLTTQDYHSYKKGRVLVYLSNDDSCFYIDMKIPEIPDQTHILRTGLTVWVSTDGKHHKTDGIKFPVGTGRPGSYSGRGQVSQNNSAGSLDQVKTIELMGFGKEEPQILPSDNKNNVRGHLWYDRIGDLFYRLTIPFSKFPGADQAGYKPGNLLTFGVEFSGGSSNSGHSGGTGQHGGGMGGGGHSHGGGGGGGFGGGGGGGFGGGGMGYGRGGGGMRGGSSYSGGQGGGSNSQQSAVMLWIKDITLATH
ncbi:MAG: hypothetical protein ABR974_10265 [Bacteroidales bacterium]|jgi:hypothetical protein